MRKKTFLTIMVLSVAVTLVCPEQASAGNLTVAVAANAQFVFEALQRSFTEQNGGSVSAIIGSSGKLTLQIENGAPYDIFLSADMTYPRRLVKDGWAVAPVAMYARGALVLWSLNEKNLGPDTLSAGSVARIAIADPRVAPYGAQAVHALKALGCYERIKDKLVFGESIGQVNQFVLSRAADLGLTAKSVVMSPELRGRGYWVEVKPDLYRPIEQGCVILSYGKRHHPEDAAAFIAFLRSSRAKRILKQYGYLMDE